LAQNLAKRRAFGRHWLTRDSICIVSSKNVETNGQGWQRRRCAPPLNNTLANQLAQRGGGGDAVMGFRGVRERPTGFPACPPCCPASLSSTPLVIHTSASRPHLRYTDGILMSYQKCLSDSTVQLPTSSRPTSPLTNDRLCLLSARRSSQNPNCRDPTL
jgi:hypothetical protein